jgi:hypothetical protein
MIVVKMDNKKEFEKQMKNLIAYSEGFLDGIQKGKRAFLKSVGENTKEILEAFIDSNARVNPESLHHVYEWYQSGSPEARLFEISYTVSNIGLTMNSSFSQSKSIARGSKEPFYDKARVMESGVSVIIKPRESGYLKFDVGTDTVFTPNPVAVSSPGGAATTGSFNKVFDLFFQNYFTQAFLESSGLRRSVSNVSIYAKTVSAGMRGGRPVGNAAGQKWVMNLDLEGR